MFTEIALTFAAALCAEAPADSALLAHWPMERVEMGKLIDRSGQGHNAVMTGQPEAGPKVVEGIVGNALEFPAGHTLAFTVQRSKDFDVAKGITVMAWVRPAVGNRAMAIACKKGDKSGKPPWPGWRLRFFWRRAMFQFGAADGQEPRAASPNWSVPAKFWSHVAASYDGQAIRIYVNAVEKANAPCDAAIAPQRRPLVLANYIGRKNAYPFVGVLDEIKIFSRALSAVEILAQAAAGGHP